MIVYNRHGFHHQHTTGFDVAGREFFVMVIKGTWAVPDHDGGALTLLPQADQRPLVFADTFTGAPGFSATLWETDFAFRKTACDVVVQGAAHAPEGRKAARVQVGLRIGDWHKTLMVVGHREWRVVGPAIMATDPYPFTRQPFGYDTAFGGTDRTDPDAKGAPAYMPNPVGRGYAHPRSRDRLTGVPLPNTEEVGVEVTSPFEEYRPMALGPIWRGRADRLRHGGTYDQHWQDNVFPFLPQDFDIRYHQQVGSDQQITPPASGLEVTLLNLTPRGRERFRLPRTDLPVQFYRGRERAWAGTLRPDTLLLDTEARLLSMVWRADVPIRRSITEFTETWIGAPPGGLVRARMRSKRYVPRGGRYRLPGDTAVVR